MNRPTNLLSTVLSVPLLSKKTEQEKAQSHNTPACRSNPMRTVAPMIKVTKTVSSVVVIIPVHI